MNKLSVETKLSECKSLGDQIRIISFRMGRGWESVADELVKISEDWFGNEPCKTKKDMKFIVQEIFRLN